MLYLSTLSLILLLVGIFTSKELIEAGQLLFFFTALKCIYDNFKSKTLALPKSAYWMLGFIAIALISIWINAEDIPRPSINRAKLKYPLYGVLGIYVFRCWLREANVSTKKWVANLFLSSVLISSLYGIAIFFIENQIRMNGLVYISRQAYASSFFLIILFASLLYKEKLKDFLNYHFAVITFIFTFVGMLLTFSRAPMFSFILALPVALFFYKRKIAYITGTIALGLFLAAVGYYFVGSKNTDARFLITKVNQSDAERKSVWLTAYYAIKERPLLGWGYFNLKKQMKRIKEQYDLPEKDFFESHSHNNFLEITASAGFIGLIPFLGWLFCWIRETFRHTWGRRIFVPFGVVFLLTSQVEVTIIDSHLSTFIYLIYAFSSALYEKRDEIMA
jgi:O-antigen ligase